MSQEKEKGPDFETGVVWNAVEADSMTRGHVGGEPAILVRKGDVGFIVGAKCTHYGAPLENGCIAGQTIRCPWHHAAFDLRTGQAERGPGIAPIGTWETRLADGCIYAVGDKRDGVPSDSKGPTSVTIVGTGAAGFAALATLRQLGYRGPINVFGEETEAEYDRTKLSKAFLAGDCGEDALGLGAAPLDLQANTHRHRGKRVVGLSKDKKQLQLEGNATHTFDTLVLATGAAPKHLKVPGGDLPHVRTLRSHQDCQAIIGQVQTNTRVVVVGGSFIGMEAAASLHRRGAHVTVINKHAVPLANVLGTDLGKYLQSVHEKNEVRFINNAQVTRVSASHVDIDDGQKLPADLVVLGIGVAPAVDIAQSGGLSVDDGVLVNQDFRTSRADIYAIGDVARWPNPFAKGTVRIEHWAVATRTGQQVARSLMGISHPAPAQPFFWTEHFNVKLRYVGHASGKDTIKVYGDFGAGRAAVTYSDGKDLKALATIGCDSISLVCEKAMESQRYDEAFAVLEAAFKK